MCVGLDTVSPEPSTCVNFGNIDTDIIKIGMQLKKEPLVCTCNIIMLKRVLSPCSYMEKQTFVLTC